MVIVAAPSNQEPKVGHMGHSADHVILHITAVLDQLSSFHWDVPGDCILALSQCIGVHMGGTSGAVRGTKIIL